MPLLCKYNNINNYWHFVRHLSIARCSYIFPQISKHFTPCQLNEAFCKFQSSKKKTTHNFNWQFSAYIAIFVGRDHLQKTDQSVKSKWEIYSI